MAGAIKLSATARQSTIVLAADPDLAAASVAINTSFVVDIALRVSALAGNGGLRLNLRLPTGSTGFVITPWQYSEDDHHLSPVRSLSIAGIGINVGASPQDYFLLDFGGPAFTGMLSAMVAFRTGGTAGGASLEWCQNRSLAVATTLGIGSCFSARNP